MVGYLGYENKSTDICKSLTNNFKNLKYFPAENVISTFCCKTAVLSGCTGNHSPFHHWNDSV